VVVAEPTPKPPPPEPKPPPPAMVAFTLQTEPPGAEVELDGEKKGLTPLDVKLEKAKLPLVAKLTRDGFEPTQTTLNESEPLVSLTLKKKAVARSPGGKTPAIKTSR